MKNAQLRLAPTLHLDNSLDRSSLDERVWMWSGNVLNDTWLKQPTSGWASLNVVSRYRLERYLTEVIFNCYGDDSQVTALGTSSRGSNNNTNNPTRPLFFGWSSLNVVWYRLERYLTATYSESLDSKVCCKVWIGCVRVIGYRELWSLVVVTTNFGTFEKMRYGTLHCTAWAGTNHVGWDRGGSN